MKRVFMLVLGMVFLASCAYASDWPAACGADSVQYKVKTAKSAYSADAPSPGMARIVLIETKDSDLPSPLIRFALDGSWIGADKGDSYFVASINPGTHVLCGSRQSAARADKENRAVIKIDAEAGKTYYFLFTVKKDVIGSLGRSNGGAGGAASAPGTGSTPNMTAKDPDFIEIVDFSPLDDSQAASALKKSQLSTATQK